MPVGDALGLRPDGVDDAPYPAAAPAGLVHGCQCVGGLAGLGDAQHGAVGRDQRLTVAILRSVVDLDGDTGDALNQELADEGGISGGAASDQCDALGGVAGRKRQVLQ